MLQEFENAKEKSTEKEDCENVKEQSTEKEECENVKESTEKEKCENVKEESTEKELENVKEESTEKGKWVGHCLACPTNNYHKSPQQSTLLQYGPFPLVQEKNSYLFCAMFSVHNMSR